MRWLEGVCSLRKRALRKGGFVMTRRIGGGAVDVASKN